MSNTFFSVPSTSFLALSIGLFCSGAHAQLRYSGSDTVEPVVAAARTAFLRSAPAFQLAIVGSGSSVGLRDLCGGRSMLVGSSRPIKTEESKECERTGVRPVEIPVAIDAVVLVVSSKNTFVKDLKLADIKRIYEPGAAGKLMDWKTVRADWPSTPLKTVGVNVKHGTFEFFHSAIGNNKFTRSDIRDTAQHDETAKLVAADPGAIGYVPLSVAKDFASQLRTLNVDFGQGAIEPTQQNVVAGKYSELSRTVYLYVNVAMVTKEGAEAQRFVKELLGGMEKYVAFANMTALSTVQYQDSLRRVNLGN